MSKPLTYICSPYSHDDPHIRWQRWRAVVQYTGDLLKRGHLAFSPIAHSHPIAVECGMGLDFEAWEELDTAMMERCEAMHVLQLDGWQESKGIAHELAWWDANKNSRPKYVEPTE